MKLAIDIGTKCGIAVADNDNNIGFSNCINLYASSKLPSMVRFVEFRNLLGELYKQYRFGSVIYEKVHNHAGILASHMYGGFEAIICMFCYENNILIGNIGVGSIKKLVTGKGNASKAEVIEAVNRQLGSSITNENEADAVAIILAIKANDEVVNKVATKTVAKKKNKKL